MTTKPNPTRPAVPVLRFSAEATEAERLAAVVLASPKLWAVIAPDDVDPLVLGHEAATKALQAVAALPTPEHTSAAATVEARLRSGEVPDVAALVEELAADQAARVARKTTADLLSTMPPKFRREIVATVEAYAPDYFDALSADLDAVLDAAAETVANLNGATTADEAIENGTADEWRRLRAISHEYAELRYTHLALLRVTDRAAFSAGSTAWAFAMFAGLADVLPRFVQITSGADRDLAGNPAGLAWPVYDVADVAHLLAVVRLRDRLRPHVASPDQASSAMAQAGTVGVAVPAPLDRSLTDAQREALLQRARAEAGNRGQAEREELAARM